MENTDEMSFNCNNNTLFGYSDDMELGIVLNLSWIELLKCSLRIMLAKLRFFTQPFKQARSIRIQRNEKKAELAKY